MRQPDEALTTQIDVFGDLKRIRLPEFDASGIKLRPEPDCIRQPYED